MAVVSAYPQHQDCTSAGVGIDTTNAVPA